MLELIKQDTQWCLVLLLVLVVSQVWQCSQLWQIKRAVTAVHVVEQGGVPAEFREPPLR